MNQVPDVPGFFPEIVAVVSVALFGITMSGVLEYVECEMFELRKELLECKPVCRLVIREPNFDGELS